MNSFGQAALNVGIAILDLYKARRDRAIGQSVFNQLRRAKVADSHVKQYDETENTLTERLAPVLEQQINKIASNLYGLTLIESDDVRAIAEDLIRRAYNPRDWDKKIIDTSVPVMALSMVVTVVTFFREMGVDIIKSTKDASNWVEENPDDWEELMQEVQKVGLPFGIMTQLPDDLKAIIMRELKNSFSQEYWSTISDTTKDDVITYLMQGIERGWSIDKMASKMAEVFQGTGTYQYARMRARRIAITEVGNALNSMRKESTAIIQQEIPQAGIRQEWLSILSDTTRDTHANLDGVPEDENGMWNLAGINIPWPAHYSLPPGERINCRCSLAPMLGVSDEEAQQLINEYWERVNEVVL